MCLLEAGKVFLSRAKNTTNYLNPYRVLRAYSFTLPLGAYGLQLLCLKFNLILFNWGRVSLLVVKQNGKSGRNTAEAISCSISQNLSQVVIYKGGTGRCLFEPTVLKGLNYLKIGFSFEVNNFSRIIGVT